MSLVRPVQGLEMLNELSVRKMMMSFITHLTTLEDWNAQKDTIKMKTPKLERSVMRDEQSDMAHSPHSALLVMKKIGLYFNTKILESI